MSMFGTDLRQEIGSRATMGSALCRFARLHGDCGRQVVQMFLCMKGPLGRLSRPFAALAFQKIPLR